MFEIAIVPYKNDREDLARTHSIHYPASDVILQHPSQVAIRASFRPSHSSKDRMNRDPSLMLTPRVPTPSTSVLIRI